MEDRFQLVNVVWKSPEQIFVHAQCTDSKRFSKVFLRNQFKSLCAFGGRIKDHIAAGDKRLDIGES